MSLKMCVFPAADSAAGNFCVLGRIEKEVAENAQRIFRDFLYFSSL